jgi:hypothetical protein
MAKPNILVIEKKDTSLKIAEALFENEQLIDIDTQNPIDLMALITATFEEGDSLKILVGRSTTEQSEADV